MHREFIVTPTRMRRQRLGAVGDELSARVGIRAATEACLAGDPAYSNTYHLFRLLAHLAKYLTAELALEVSHWPMQAQGAFGILAEFDVTLIPAQAGSQPPPKRQPDPLRRQLAHFIAACFNSDMPCIICRPFESQSLPFFEYIGVLNQPAVIQPDVTSIPQSGWTTGNHYRKPA